MYVCVSVSWQASVSLAVSLQQFRAEGVNYWADGWFEQGECCCGVSHISPTYNLRLYIHSKRASPPASTHTSSSYIYALCTRFGPEGKEQGIKPSRIFYRRIQIRMRRFIVSETTWSRKKRLRSHTGLAYEQWHSIASCVFFFFHARNLNCREWWQSLRLASCSHREPEKRQDYWQVPIALFSACVKMAAAQVLPVMGFLHMWTCARAR